MGKQWKQWLTVFFWVPKPLQMVIAARKLKDACSLGKRKKKKTMTNLEGILKKQRHYFANKGLYSQSCGFSSRHVWMWELDHKEGSAPKNWYFWTVVLKKTFENPLDCKEIKSVDSRWNPPWILIERTDAEGETPILWQHDSKSWLIRKDPGPGKDWRQEKWMTEDEMVGWHHWL